MTKAEILQLLAENELGGIEWDDGPDDDLVLGVGVPYRGGVLTVAVVRVHASETGAIVAFAVRPPSEAPPEMRAKAPPAPRPGLMMQLMENGHQRLWPCEVGDFTPDALALAVASSLRCAHSFMSLWERMATRVGGIACA